MIGPGRVGPAAGDDGSSSVAAAPAPDGDQVDVWLASAAAERDEGAFEQLVRRHTGALYAGALRVTGSPELAQDVVQEAWLSAWLSLPGFRGQSTVRTWLVRIVTTRSLNALRRPPGTVPLEAAPEPVTAGTEAEVESRARAAAVRAAIAALPVRQREAVVLRDLEGLSYEEVARGLGCTVGSVKSALFRGRQALAVALEEHRPSGSGSAAGSATSTSTSTPAQPTAGGHP